MAPLLAMLRPGGSPTGLEKVAVPFAPIAVIELLYGVPITPVVAPTQVAVRATFMVQLTLSGVGGTVALSVTVTVYVNVPAWLGVPVTEPVAPIASPGGIEPVVTA